MANLIFTHRYLTTKFYILFLKFSLKVFYHINFAKLGEYCHIFKNNATLLISGKKIDLTYQSVEAYQQVNYHYLENLKALK